MVKIVEIKIIDDIKYKECRKCNQLKGFDEYYNSNTDKTGKHQRCKDCFKQYYKDNYSRLKNYREERKDIKCDYSKEYQKKNKEKYKKYQSEYHKENKRNYSDYYKEYFHNKRIYDPEFKLKCDLRSKNRTNLQRAIKYYLEGRIDKLPSKSPSRLLLKLYETQNHVCPYCSSDMRDNIHIDHITPLSKNGSNDVENLILCCSTCNLSKSAKDLKDWLKECNINYNDFIDSIEERNRMYFSEEIISA